MQPRWHAHQPEAPLVPSPLQDQEGSEPKETYFTEPLADLERQLAAELSGAAWGVVAFAPEDGLWCDWIYRNLNGYRLPPSLVERVTPHGFPRPDCLSVFPDRRDPEYEAQYPQAVREGVYLIVVCSADSANCPAVGETIRAFKEAGGSERIIALVVDGPPDLQLGERLRAQDCDWLPAWLRGRMEEDGFRKADRSEPRVVDARGGYRNLTQVRDGLLTALVDMDAGEFERLGGCNRPVDSVILAHPTPAANASEMSTSVALQPILSPTRRSGSRYTICMAIVLVVVAVVFGMRTYFEITADEPPSPLEVGPVTGALPGYSDKERIGGNADQSPSPVAPPVLGPLSTPDDSDVAVSTPPPAATPAPAATATPPEVTVAQSAPPPAPPPSAVISSAPPAPSAKPNVTQLAPAAVYPTSRIVPVSTTVAERVPPTSAPSAPAPSASNNESDAVLLDEVHTLERRGDETMADKRTEDALDLYNSALQSAEEFALRKSATPQGRDQVVALMCKLGILELQNSSTAEAKATFIRARKALLEEKKAGQWNRERSKTLDQIESRLLSLPRD